MCTGEHSKKILETGLIIDINKLKVDNWNMKGEIQFCGTNGQTDKHTNICPSKAASSQLKTIF